MSSKIQEFVPDVRQNLSFGGRPKKVYRRGAPSPLATVDTRSFQKVPYESSTKTKTKSRSCNIL